MRAAALAGADAPGRAIGARTLGAMLCLSFGLLLLPAAIAPVPPLWDYPNHLARLWLLSGGAASVGGWYHVVWDSWTNVGVDAIAAPIARTIGWMPTGRLLVAAAVVLPPLGAAALWRAVHGRAQWWLLAFATLAWSTPLIGGFLNFQIGIGLALLAASVDLWPLGPRAGRFVARSMAALVLIGVHPFGFVLYAGLLAGLAFGPTWRAPAGRIGRLALAAAALAWPALLMLLAAPRLPGAQAGASVTTLLGDIAEGWRSVAGDPAGKAFRLLEIVTAYEPALDRLTARLVLAPVALSALFGRLRGHAGLLLAALGFALGFLGCPDRLGGTHWMDARFAVMAPLTAAVALAPGLPAFSSRVAAAALLGIACLRSVSIAAIWHERQADVASVALALRAAEPGKRILPVQQRPADVASVPEGRWTVLGGSSFRHLPTLALPWRQDFVPTLFAARGKQPIEVDPSMRAMAEPEGGELAGTDALRDAAALARDEPFAPYLRRWRERFDYVLVLGAEIPGQSAVLGPQDGLDLVADAGFARLYAIR